MPASVSVATLITFTALLFLFAYSLKNIAEPTPSGTAIASDIKINSNVPTSAGSIVGPALSSALNSDGVILSTPFTSTYTIIARRKVKESTVET